MVLYGEKGYWNNRYTVDKEPYEWYQSYHSIRQLLTPGILSASYGIDLSQPCRALELTTNCHQGESISSNFQPSKAQARVLILGCGNSRFSEDMLQDGWTGGITNVDFSDVVIEQMQQKYNDADYQRFSNIVLDSNQMKHAMTFVCADVTVGLPFDDYSFDIIVCKGCMDAILQKPGHNVRRMMAECHRLLRGGTMIVVTHGNPESRIVHFENEHDEWWEKVGIHTIPKNGKHDDAHHNGQRYVGPMHN